MGKFKLIVIAIIFYIISADAFSQGVLSSMLYESNNSIENPSMVGTSINGQDYSGLTASVSRQWSDSRFALTQSIATFEHSFDQGFGIEASFRNSKYGGFFTENASILGARYRLKINSQGSTLSFGMSGMVAQSKADFHEASIEVAADPMLTGVFLFSKRIDFITGITYNFGYERNYSHRLTMSQSSFTIWKDDSYKFNNSLFFEYVLMKNLYKEVDNYQKAWFFTLKYKYYQNGGGIVECAFDCSPKASPAFRFGLTQQIDMNKLYYNSIAFRIIYMPFTRKKAMLVGGYSQAIVLSGISNSARNIGEYFISFRK